MAARPDDDLFGVKWKRTRRECHPDICGCITEYQYNVLAPQEELTENPRAIKFACKNHPVSPVLLEIVRGFGERWFKREDFQRYQDLWFMWRDQQLDKEPPQPSAIPTPPQEIIEEFESVYAQIRENMRRWGHAFITFLNRIHGPGFAENLGSPHFFDLDQRYWTEWTGKGENRVLHTHYLNRPYRIDKKDIIIATQEDLDRLQDECDTMFGINSVIVG